MKRRRSFHPVVPFQQRGRRVPSVINHHPQTALRIVKHTRHLPIVLMYYVHIHCCGLNTPLTEQRPSIGASLEDGAVLEAAVVVVPVMFSVSGVGVALLAGQHRLPGDVHLPAAAPRPVLARRTYSRQTGDPDRERHTEYNVPWWRSYAAGKLTSCRCGSQNTDIKCMHIITLQADAMN